MAEHDAGRGLADLAVLPDGRHLLAVDRAANELLLIAYDNRSPHVVGRIAVAPDPVRVVVSPDGASAVVSSTWPRRLTFVSLAPRAPRIPVPRYRSPAASTCRLARARWRRSATARGWSSPTPSAAGSRSSISIAGRSSRSARCRRTTSAGWPSRPTGGRLLLAHQMLNRLAQTTFDDVHWGQLIRNHLRVLRVESLLAAGSDSALLDGGRLFDLGDVGYAAGDPGAIAFDRRGRVIVALEGMDEVAIAAGLDQGREPGRRGPTAVGRGVQPGRGVRLRRRLAR